LPPLGEKYPLAKLPFIRGIINLIEMMSLGVKTLNYSADIAMEEEEPKKTKKEKQKSDGWQLGLTLILSLVFAILLFKLIPLALTQYLLNKDIIKGSFAFNLVDGIIRLAIFLLYIWIISLFKDMYRVFQYHAAEHMSVACNEQGKKLTVDNVKKCSRFHPRCGTSFIIFVMIITIFVFSLVPYTLPFWQKFLYRFLLLPFIVSISYELLRVSANHTDKWWLQPVILPGLWTQRITTKEPTDDIVEVGIAALSPLVKESSSI